MDFVLMASRVHSFRLPPSNLLCNLAHWPCGNKQQQSSKYNKAKRQSVTANSAEEVCPLKWLFPYLIWRPLRDTWITGVSDPEVGPAVSKAAKPSQLFNLLLVAVTAVSQHHLFYLSSRRCLCNAQLFTLTVSLRVFHQRQSWTILLTSVTNIFLIFHKTRFT